MIYASKTAFLVCLFSPLAPLAEAFLEMRAIIDISPHLVALILLLSTLQRYHRLGYYTTRSSEQVSFGTEEVFLVVNVREFLAFPPPLPSAELNFRFLIPVHMADSATVYVRLRLRLCKSESRTHSLLLSVCLPAHARPISLKSIVLTLFTENVPITAVNYDLLWIDQVQAEGA